MKSVFPGYYRPTDDEFKKLWSECFFTFDANVLLNLYKYSAETRDSLLAILKGIAKRCWISHRAAHEFHEHRVGVINEQVAAYRDFRNPIAKFEEALANTRKHPFLTPGTFDELKNAVTKVQNELDSRKAEVESLLSKDSILEDITAVFDGRTGNRFPEYRERHIRSIGQARYACRTPPGFKDQEKDEQRKYGDLFVWFQIIEEAKERKTPVVLVTDDRKEDWWRSEGGKTVGPLPELVEEMFRSARVRFYMYQPSSFMDFAKSYLKQPVNKEAIQEVREFADTQAVVRHAQKTMVAALISQQKAIDELAQRIRRIGNPLLMSTSLGRTLDVMAPNLKFLLESGSGLTMALEAFKPFQTDLFSQEALGMTSIAGPVLDESGRLVAENSGKQESPPTGPQPETTES